MADSDATRIVPLTPHADGTPRQMVLARNWYGLRLSVQYLEAGKGWLYDGPVDVALEDLEAIAATLREIANAR